MENKKVLKLRSYNCRCLFPFFFLRTGEIVSSLSLSRGLFSVVDVGARPECSAGGRSCATNCAKEPALLRWSVAADRPCSKMSLKSAKLAEDLNLECLSPAVNLSA